MTHTKSAKILLGAAVAILAMAFTAQYLTTDKAWLALLDNLHWTTGTVAAAGLASLASGIAVSGAGSVLAAGAA